MRRIGVDERRARLGRRHHLAPANHAADIVELARDLAGLHASDPATPYLASRARIPRFSVAVGEKALYDDRAVLRMLGMRRTMFVLPRDLGPVVQSACTDAIAVDQRRRYSKLLEQGGIAADGAEWLDEVGTDTLAALAARGEAYAAELAADVPLLREKLHFGDGTKWAGSQNMTTLVLFLLAAEGRIVRGRPRGSWTSSQHRWAPASSWLGAMPERLDPAAARAELARRWLETHGPATVVDLRWWSGWKTGEVKAALAELDPVEVDLGGTTGIVLPGDDEPVDPPGPWATLVPGLDPAVMGWKEREWYLGDHGAALFDRSGNPGPTIWWSGRIVGGWAQRPDATVVYRLLEDIGGEGTVAIEAEVERLQGWLGGTRVIPRFRTPLERELSG